VRASSRRAAFGRGLEALLLLAVVTLTTGCSLIIPVPGKVDAGHSGSATAALQHDDGLVIVVARDTGNRELEEHVISCAREAMEKMPLAPRIVAADTSLRNAFRSLQEGEHARQELAADPSFQEHITTLNLCYALLVSMERGKNPREWETTSGGGAAIMTAQKASYALSGILLDLASGQDVSSISARSEADSFAIWMVPILMIWVPRWIREDKVCLEFGRELAAMLQNEQPRDPVPTGGSTSASAPR